MITYIKILALTAIFSFGSVPLAFSFGEPKYSKVHLSIKQDKDSTNKLIFRVSADDTMQLSFVNAPWELNLKTIDTQPNFKLAKDKYTAKDLDQGLPGFAVQIPTKELQSGILEYRLIAFICTKEKTRCYREVHKNTVNLKTIK
ncbi:MAG: hypothetical protein R3B45_07080 [Bdellovibrionota bacterium]